MIVYIPKWLSEKIENDNDITCLFSLLDGSHVLISKKEMQDNISEAKSMLAYYIKTYGEEWVNKYNYSRCCKDEFMKFEINYLGDVSSADL